MQGEKGRGGGGHRKGAGEEKGGKREREGAYRVSTLLLLVGWKKEKRGLPPPPLLNRGGREVINKRSEIGSLSPRPSAKNRVLSFSSITVLQAGSLIGDGASIKRPALVYMHWHLVFTHKSHWGVAFVGKRKSWLARWSWKRELVPPLIKILLVSDKILTVHISYIFLWRLAQIILYWPPKQKFFGPYFLG